MFVLVIVVELVTLDSSMLAISQNVIVVPVSSPASLSLSVTRPLTLACVLVSGRI